MVKYFQFREGAGTDQQEKASTLFSYFRERIREEEGNCQTIKEEDE